MKRTALGLLVVLAFFSLGVSKVWNAAFEAEPAGTDLASDLDTFINVFKEEVRQRAAVELIWGNGTNDNGLLRVGASRCFIQNGAPTDIVGPGAFNSTADAYVSTLLTTTEPGGADDVGKGRCWIDLDGPDNVSGTPDDRSYATWDETNNIWKYQSLANPSATTVAEQRFMFDPGKVNQLYNGSFEVTDGTGLVASTSVPAGWALVATNPTLAYATETTTEGTGLDLTMTRGAGDGGIEQTVVLKTNTTYYVMARAKAAGGGSCELSTLNAGGTNLAAQTTASATYTTLSGTFTTTVAAGTADTLTIRLRVLTAGSCTVDNIALYETTADKRGITTPSGVGCFDTDTSTTNDIYTTAGTFVDALVLCEVTIPGPGYMVQIDGVVVADNDTAAESLTVRLREEGVTKDVKTVLAGPDNDGANHSEDIVIVPVHFLNTSPTPGTTLSYTLEAAPGNASGNPSFDRNLGDDGADDVPDGANLATNIRVILIPPR